MRGGITSFGAYLPRNRIPRTIIAQANSWANSGLASLADGQRSFAGPDEDSLTMGVQAARNCLGVQHAVPSILRLASTTAPFADRANGVLASEALQLLANVRCSESSGFLGAGMMALMDALDHCESNLVIASDMRQAKPGSVPEMMLGHGAAAVMTGHENSIARYVAGHVVSADFVDHFRAAGSQFDYGLEERWIRDEGHARLVPPAIAEVLARASLSPASIDRVVFAGIGSASARSVAKQAGLDASRLVEALHGDIGNAGTAEPFLMLQQALEMAGAKETILLVNFAQGVQAIVLETTEALTRYRPLHPLAEQVASGRIEENYIRFLAFCGQIEIDRGIRAERDNRTALSAFNRHRHEITGFVGGKCRSCGTRQFPKGRACVNPACRAIGTLDDEPFQDKIGRVKSFTEDWLAISPSPPLRYGNVAFPDDGGVVMMEFTDFEPDQLKVGAQVRFVFRIKDRDRQRGFCRYFWKAAPAAEADNG